MKRINYITTNQNKFNYFSSFFKDHFEINQLNTEVVEIQASDNRQVAEFSAEWTANKYDMPVIKEDVGFYIHALKGFPGPYLTYIEKWIESEGFLNLLKDKEDRSAYWEYAIAYCEPGKKPQSFFVQQKGLISDRVRGDSGYFTDKIFIPESQSKTISELLDEGTYHRDDNHYRLLKEYLLSKDTLLV